MGFAAQVKRRFASLQNEATGEGQTSKVRRLSNFGTAIHGAYAELT